MSGVSLEGGALVLRRGKERSLERRHPWIYPGAIDKVQGRPAAGDLVLVRSADGRFLAWAAYAPGSGIAARCWSFQETDRIDAAWFGARVAAAVARRAPLAADSDALRLVFGESDGLPGFVADRYAGQLVVQIQSAGAEAQREVLLDALCAASGSKDVFDRSDNALRAREGLAPAMGVARGEEPPERIEVAEHGIRYLVDVRRGHKTGFYIDQRDNRGLLARRVELFGAEHGRAPRVLNCFCYTGGFSLAAARAGAAQVVSVDSSADALATGAQQAARNGIDPGLLRWTEADVFAELRALQLAGERFDLIVLDPPKFAASQHQVDRAARAYKDINLQALRLLEPGGELFTFSCSGAIDAGLFHKIVAGAVIDARVECLLRARLAAGEDHAMRMTHPEGEYLKGLLLERTA
jgi:23S rRNA (cytosine1962-C5)-methyltransferase